MARSRPAGAFHRSARAAAEEMSGNGNGGGGGRSPTGTAKKSVSPLEGLLFKRMRSSSLTGLPVRRRKGDFFRDVIRSIRDIASWSGGLKVGLFLLLAGTMWMVIAIFATTDEHNQHASRDPTQRMTPLEEATAGITAAAASAALDGPIEPTIVRATVLRTFAHDPSAFTQGLLVDDGIFWEGTGLYGQSEVRRVSLESGEVLDSFKIPYAEFGEGITMFNDKIFQITWREHKGYVYHANNFTLGPSQTWTYRMEGWGLTHNSSHLLLSDGSSTLYFFDPNTLNVVSKLRVRWFRDGRWREVKMLNELEWIDGYIYANIWMSNYIVVICPNTGVVKKVIDATALHPNPKNHEMTLNGIAWDDTERKLYITGKLWPTMFEIEFVGSN